MNENMKFLEARRYALEQASLPLSINRLLIEAELADDAKAEIQ